LGSAAPSLRANRSAEGRHQLVSSHSSHTPSRTSATRSGAGPASAAVRTAAASRLRRAK
jgi:hypothetical protein